MITRKKITLILTELLCPCFLFFNINFRVVTVGIKALAWVQELNWNLISIKLVQVVHIRQDEMADCSSAWERGQDPELEHKEIEREREREREDSLEDSASHIPATPHLREVPPPTTVVLATTPAPYSDPVFIAHIVRAVIETMPQVPVPAPLVAPTT